MATISNDLAIRPRGKPKQKAQQTNVSRGRPPIYPIAMGNSVSYNYTALYLYTLAMFNDKYFIVLTQLQFTTGTNSFSTRPTCAPFSNNVNNILTHMPVTCVPDVKNKKTTIQNIC